MATVPVKIHSTPLCTIPATIKKWLIYEIFYCIMSLVPKGVSGCGSVWLEYLVWDQGVAGSNPVTPIYAIRAM